MADDLLKHLYDIQAAASAILRFVRGKTFDDYEEDELLRSRVSKSAFVGCPVFGFKRLKPALFYLVALHFQGVGGQPDFSTEAQSIVRKCLIS